LSTQDIQKLLELQQQGQLDPTQQLLL